MRSVIAVVKNLNVEKSDKHALISWEQKGLGKTFILVTFREDGSPEIRLISENYHTVRQIYEGDYYSDKETVFSIKKNTWIKGIVGNDNEERPYGMHPER